MKEIQELLNQLANERAKIDVLNLREQVEIDKILTPEIRAKIEIVKAEYAEQSEVTRDAVKALEFKIKKAVIDHGQSVKSDFLMATWNKPRITWDSKGLSGYAVAHPEITAFRKTGNPTSTIRVVK